MPRPKRKFRYTIFNHSKDNYYSVKTKDSYKNFEMAKTFKEATKWAFKMGYGAEVERRFLIGKHKGKCQVFTYEKPKFKRGKR